MKVSDVLQDEPLDREQIEEFYHESNFDRVEPLFAIEGREPDNGYVTLLATLNENNEKEQAVVIFIYDGITEKWRKFRTIRESQPKDAENIIEDIEFFIADRLDENVVFLESKSSYIN